MKTATATDALHTAHLATLAAAHTTTIRLTSAQSAAWDDDSATRTQLTARTQGRADKTGKTWFIVSRASILLATVTPANRTAIEDDGEDDVIDFGACI